MGGQHRRGGRSELAKYLADLRAQQAQRRTRVHSQTAFDEVGAVKRLAYELFGDLGVVEFDMNTTTSKRLGQLCIGVFIDPPVPKGQPKFKRRIRPMFQGASHRELVDQVNLWKAKRA